MRKIFLLVFVILSARCHAQDYMAGRLAERRTDDNTHDTIKRTNWQVLERASIGRKLNTFYRISRINGNYFLDLKIIEGGSVFVVARNAALKLLLESGQILVLHNAAYTVSCKGCGARGYGGDNAEGVMLTFPMSADDIRILLHNFVAAVGINTGEDYLEKKVNEAHSELFLEELQFIHRLAE